MKKKCPKCGQLKDSSDFHKSLKKKHRLTDKCKLCVHEYQQLRKNSFKFNYSNDYLKSKRCSHCKEIKRLNEFSKHSYSQDGRRTQCKQCDGKKGIARRDKIKNGSLNFISRENGKKICSVCNQEKNIKEFSKDKYLKDGRTSACNECREIQHRKWRIRNPEYNYYMKNKKKCQTNNKKWEDKNKGKRRAIVAKRHAITLNATPPWADYDKIKRIYEMAQIITEKTGIPYNVDHIFPLQGENSCGLHVHYNLRIISESENKSKQNKIPEYLIKQYLTIPAPKEHVAE